MPDAKYFDRSGKGLTKQNLGEDNEDLQLPLVPAAEQHGDVDMPTEKTTDEEVDQDGNEGKPFFKTLESRRRGVEGSESGHDDDGGTGGPNAQ